MVDNPERLKYLEFIQGAIARMASNSTLFRGWCITVAAALAAFAAIETRVGLVSIAVVSTLLFWGLDAYYLWLERGFIRLYSAAVESATQVTWEMSVDKTDAFRSWLRTCFRPHLLAFYGAILAVEILAIILLKAK